ncbi:MAG: winged helix-turn-helix domain-containing protein [Lachnospiraceae bacterium]|nr:winged helix-turn-helix domain-containing protein [Lachnospiraceae bacterium]
MEDSIVVKTFGGFSMSYGENSISDQDNRSKKTWTIIEYLIANHSRSITQTQLISLLWSDDSMGDAPENALKTCLHRAREVLDKLGTGFSGKLILHKRGIFSWNPDAKITTDFDEFESHCQLATVGSTPEDEKLAHFKAAIDLYKGDFLPKCSDDDWAIPIITYYHTLYVNSVHSYITLLESKEMYQEIVDCCCFATNIDPYDEQIHYFFILALYKLGKQQAALDRYDSVLNLFYNSYGLNPSQRLMDLHDEIIKSENSFEADLSTIQSDLADSSVKRGAFRCEYSIFRSLYKVQARMIARSGQSIYLCLITMTVPKKLSAPKYLSTAMTRMNDVITRSLRSSDVFSRYSKNQYIIMLPAACYENSLAIGERILKNYDASKPKLQVRASFMVRYIEPQVYDEETETSAPQ